MKETLFTVRLHTLVERQAGVRQLVKVGEVTTGPKGAFMVVHVCEALRDGNGSRRTKSQRTNGDVTFRIVRRPLGRTRRFVVNFRSRLRSDFSQVKTQMSKSEKKTKFIILQFYYKTKP